MTFTSFSLKRQYIFTTWRQIQEDHLLNLTMTEITPPAKHAEDCSRPAHCRLWTTDITNHCGLEIW